MLDERLFWPSVLQVIATDNFEVYIYFNDGSVHLFNMLPLIKAGTVFEALRDKDIFKEQICVMNDTVAWILDGDCIDLDPLVLFKSPLVSDPFEDETGTHQAFLEV